MAATYVKASTQYHTAHEWAAARLTSAINTGAISLWFKSGTTNASDMAFSLSNYLIGANWRGLQLVVGNSGSWAPNESVSLYVWSNNRDGDLFMHYRAGHDTLRNNAWHHIVAIVDGAFNRFIIDGVAQGASTFFERGSGSTSYLFADMDANSGTPQAFIGGFDNDQTMMAGLTGSVADVRIFSTAITDDYAKRLYRARGGDRERKYLIGHWPLIGTPVETTGGYNATAVNSPTYTDAPMRCPRGYSC